MPDSLIHPTREDLTAFSLGQLAAAEAADIESHISECESRCETLLGLSSDDTFVALLRKGFESPSEQTVDPITNSEDPILSDTSEVPPSLVNHPRYRVLGVIRQGGTGDVYQAQHRLMNRIVALKVIKRDLVDKPDAIERLRRDLQAAARLSHPNIVTAHDADQAGDAYFLVMEYVDGTELSEIVEREGPLTVGIACDYVRQVAQGLQHAHESDMVHRDIKPQNLMVTSVGQVKILDFGLASLVHYALADGMMNTESGDDKAPTTRLTSLGTVMGTPDYVSPEQTVDASAADIRSDIYGLGCTLYYLLTGQPPFPGGSAAEEVSAHTEREPRPLGELRDDIPPGLELIVRRMMAKDPADRFKDPSEVAEALSPFVEREESPKTHTAASNGRFWRRWVAVAAAAFLVGLTFFLTIRTSQGTVTVEIADADAKDVDVVFRQGDELHIASAKQGWQIRLKEGKWDIDIGNSSGKFQLDKKMLTLVRGGQETVKVTLKQKPEPFQRTGEPLLATLRGHEELVTGVATSPCQDVAATSSRDGSIKLWNLATGELVATLRSQGGVLSSVAFSPDGTTLASVDGRKIILWDVATKKPLGTFKEGALGRVRFSPDGKTIAAEGPRRRSIKIWNLKNGSLVKSLDLKNPRLEELTTIAFAFGPEGRRLAVAGDRNRTEGWLMLFDVESGRELWKIRGDRRAVLCAAFSPDGKTLATGNGDHTVRLYDATRGRLRAQLPGSHRSFVSQVAFSPDGKVLASKCGDIFLWDVASRRKIATFPESEASLGWVHVAFSRDGQTLVSCSNNRDIKLWDVRPARDQYRVLPLIEQGRYREAALEFAHLAESFPADHTLWHSHATSLLAAGDQHGYQDVCRKMVDHFRDTSVDHTMAAVILTCTQTPDALKDWTPLVRFSEELPDSWGHPVGFALYRAGRAVEALEALDGFVDQEIGDKLVRAMTLQRLHQPDEARKQLTEAIEEIKTIKTCPWTERVRFEHLRREAETLIPLDGATVTEPEKKHPATAYDGLAPGSTPARDWAATTAERAARAILERHFPK